MTPVLELNVTPNRGDAMSVIGIAREVAALTGVPASPDRAIGRCSAEAHATAFAVQLDAPAACPRFVGCVMRGVDNRGADAVVDARAAAPRGLRSISPVVDVTNYVMLELGQPMHAYDLAKLQGEHAVPAWRKQARPSSCSMARTVEARSPTCW